MLLPSASMANRSVTWTWIWCFYYLPCQFGGDMTVNPESLLTFIQSSKVRKTVQYSCLMEWRFSFFQLEFVRPLLTTSNLFSALINIYCPALNLRQKPVPSTRPAPSRDASWVPFKFLCVSFPTLVSKMRRGSLWWSPALPLFTWFLKNRTCF